MNEGSLGSAAVHSSSSRVEGLVCVFNWCKIRGAIEPEAD